MVSRLAADQLHKPVWIDGESYPDYGAIGIWYADQIASLRAPACHRARQGAERFLRMLEKAEKGHFKKDETFFTWSPEDVIDVCNFEEQFEHVSGFDGTLVLQPWQIFGNCLIWGFRRADGTRLVKRALEWVPRGAGKSYRSATRGLFCMTCEGEKGPLGFICGSKDDHAQKVFGPMKALVDNDDDFQHAYGASTTLHEIRVRGGHVERVTEVPNEDEGHNPHVVIMEELHKQKGGLYRVMRSSLGKRSNSLFMCISTAGKYSDGIGWDTWKESLDILDGTMPGMEHVSVLMYCADPEDETRFWEPEIIEKSMPHLGVSVGRETVMEEAHEARLKPMEKDEFLRTRLNIWTKGVSSIFSGQQLDACARKDLRDQMLKYQGLRCFMGIDIASRHDLCAITMLFEDGDEVVAFTEYLIPEKSPSFEDEHIAAQLEEWVREGWIETIPGGYNDFVELRKIVWSWHALYDPDALVLDDWQANQMTADLLRDKLPAMVMKKNARTSTEPADDLISLITSKRYVTDGNPVDRWCFLNVVAHRDEKGQILPKRDRARPYLKIDGFDAALNANAARLSPDRPKRKKASIYEKRGLAGWAKGKSP